MSCYDNSRSNKRCAARGLPQFGARANHLASFSSDHELDLQFRAAALKNNLERTKRSPWGNTAPRLSCSLLVLR